MQIAWFHCFSGIAGDMALGALIDAGADLDEVRALLQRLPVGGWEVEAEPVLRGGIAATHVRVHAEDDTVTRTAAHVTGLVEEARLPERVTRRALATFQALAEVEGRLHRRPPEQVHFHEVGGIDAIVDVVGTCAALELLEVDQVRASAVAQGTGMIRAAHGLLPNPPPAVVELLRDAPTYGIDLPMELTTPTGAALLAATASGWGPLPAMRIAASGFGAGTRELDGRPNAVQVVLGTAVDRGLPSPLTALPPAGPGPGQTVDGNLSSPLTALPPSGPGPGEAGSAAPVAAAGDRSGAPAAPGRSDEPGGGRAEGPPLLSALGVRPGQPVVLLEANVDDATGEVLAHTVQALLAAGAHDAWITPVVMKKGRPAHVVSALTDPALAEQVAGVLSAETGTLGLRGTTLERWPAARQVGTVDVDGLPIRVKVSPGRVKVEHDDAARVARHRGLPLREVLSRADQQARRSQPLPPPDQPSAPDDTPA